MPYYDSSVSDKYPEIINYFKSGILDEDKNIGHALLFWGGDIGSQCEIALEVARLLNCKKDGEKNCDCLNCRWIREQTHPAVKIYTRLDFKEGIEPSSSDEESSTGKKNISAQQARAIINELAVSSDYHRVYIFCDRDEEGNLLPLNKINFPEVTSNTLLKTFEEPPQNTTFIILTNDKNDVISTIVSRCQTFFVPAFQNENTGYEIVESFMANYWAKERNSILDFENELLNLVSENGARLVFSQMQNYILSLMSANFENKLLFYKFKENLKNVEDAKRQIALTPSMNINTVCENLAFNLILGTD